MVSDFERRNCAILGLLEGGLCYPRTLRGLCHPENFERRSCAILGLWEEELCYPRTLRGLCHRRTFRGGSCAILRSCGHRWQCGLTRHLLVYRPGTGQTHLRCSVHLSDIFQMAILCFSEDSGFLLCPKFMPTIPSPFSSKENAGLF